MSYSIFIHPKARIFLDKLDQILRKRIKKKLKELEQYPDRGTSLRPSVFWSLRVGNYRIICEIREKEQMVIVLFIGHRKNVYDSFSKLF
jgi:mRNA interferase RelE/StbE